MVFQGATGLYHFLINVIPFISNSVGNLRTISASEITNNCKVLIKKYSTDINDELINKNK